MNELFAICLTLATLGFCFMQINYSEAFTHKHWILGNIIMCTLMSCSAHSLVTAFG